MNTVTFDADEPAELAGFWAKVFGADEPEIVNPFCAIVDNPGGPNLMFIKVPESKAAKNRMHLDLHAPDADVVDAEAERLVTAGASLHQLERGARRLLEDAPATPRATSSASPPRCRATPSTTSRSVPLPVGGRGSVR